jgi:hypothetical protein
VKKSNGTTIITFAFAVLIGFVVVDYVMNYDTRPKSTQPEKNDPATGEIKRERPKVSFAQPKRRIVAAERRAERAEAALVAQRYSASAKDAAAARLEIERLTGEIAQARRASASTQRRLAEAEANVAKQKHRATTKAKLAAEARLQVEKLNKELRDERTRRRAVVGELEKERSKSALPRKFADKKRAQITRGNATRRGLTRQPPFSPFAGKRSNTANPTCRVVDIDGDDVLYIRLHPKSGTEVLGKIPPNGRGFFGGKVVYQHYCLSTVMGVCTDMGGRFPWRKVIYRNVTGWSADKYLDCS